MTLLIIHGNYKRDGLKLVLSAFCGEFLKSESINDFLVSAGANAAWRENFSRFFFQFSRDGKQKAGAFFPFQKFSRV